MTYLDLAADCKFHNKKRARNLARKHCPRLRRSPFADLEPEEVEVLRPSYQAEVNQARHEMGPDLPGLLPGPAPRVFLFDKWRVRVAVKAGKPWFVARDVLEALGFDLSNVGNKIAHVPEKWRGSYPIATPSGEQTMLILSLEGLFHFLNRSDKPDAQPFQEWVNGEVLVSIHETGSYKLPVATSTPPKTARTSPSKLPCGAQLHELRMIYGNAAAKRLDFLIGYEVHTRTADEKAPPSIAESGFRALEAIASGEDPA